MRFGLMSVLLSWCLVAWGMPHIPAAPVPVTDLTGSLSSNQQQVLTEQIQTLEQRTGHQLAVLIVATTGGLSIEDYSLQVVEQWRLGRKGIDDGVLLLLAKNDRTLRIEVGYGLEGTLTDIASKRIISDLIVPSLRAGDWFGGIQLGVTAIIQALDGQAADGAPQNMSRTDGQEAAENPLLEAGVLGLLLGGVFGRFQPKRVRSRWPLASCAALVCALVAGFLFQALVPTLIAAVAGFIGGLIPVERGRGGGGGGSGSSQPADSFKSDGFSGRSSGGFGGGGASGRW